MRFSEYQAAGLAQESTTQVTVPKEARALQGERAGFFARAVAASIDIGVVALIMVVVNGIIAFVRFVLHNASGITVPQLSASFFVGTALLWLLWAIGWSSSGRTVGLYIMGLRVIGRTGQHIGFPLALLRSALCIGFPIGLGWAMVSRENRSVQDLILRTSVINDWVMGLPSLSRRQSTE